MSRTVISGLAPARPFRDIFRRKKMQDSHDQIRIVQETVAGKEITLAHVMGGP